MLASKEFAGLLDAYHQAEGDERAGAEDELMAAMTAHFDQVLRPALRRKFSRSAQATSVQYTAMVQDFFVHVLQQRPDQFWKAQSLRALRNFASRVITNDIIDVLRRGKCANEALGDLARSRAAHFETQHGLDFEPVLSRLQEWHQQGGKHARWAKVLLHRYVDGMPRAQIAEQLGLEKSTVTNLKAEALQELRREFS